MWNVFQNVLTFSLIFILETRKKQKDLPAFSILRCCFLYLNWLDPKHERISFPCSTTGCYNSWLEWLLTGARDDLKYFVFMASFNLYNHPVMQRFLFLLPMLELRKIRRREVSSGLARRSACASGDSTGPALCGRVNRLECAAQSPAWRLAPKRGS